METTAVADVPDLLTGEALARPDRPLLTYYDDATGERVALSATGLGQWAARTTGLLRDGCGLAAGSRAAVLLPPHWQTAAVLLGVWAAGVSVSFRLAATAGLAAVGSGQDEPFDVTFVSRPRLDDWLDHVPDARHRFVLGLAPGCASLSEVPEGYRDYLIEVGRFSPDAVGAVSLGRQDAASVDGTTYREWGSLAAELADSWELRPGDRLLVDAAEHEHPVKWLLAPLAAGASVVLCANLDQERLPARLVAEDITRVL